LYICIYFIVPSKLTFYKNKLKGPDTGNVAVDYYNKMGRWSPLILLCKSGGVHGTGTWHSEN